MAGNISQLGIGSRSRTTLLPNGFSSQFAVLSLTPAITTLSGATVAGTSNLKTLLSVTGGGSRLNALKFVCSDTTARNVRVVITVDGTVVFDSTAACADTNHRAVVGAVKSDTNSSLLFQPIDALASLKIEFGCSVAETDKITFAYNYEGRS